MRSTIRLLASVKGARYLEPGIPTGLTGVYTHNSPRSTLLYVYGTTLEKLKALPESSLYRQSVEALTKHRLAIIEAAIPPGYPEWTAKVQKIVFEQPDLADKLAELQGAQGETVKVGGRTFVLAKRRELRDMRSEEWDGVESADLLEDPANTGKQEGTTLTAETLRAMEGEHKAAEKEETQIELEPEPQLTADQISEIESKIGAGLIEEVIQVAEGELKLIDVMENAKVWEQLEEKPAEGQWIYFERKSS